MKGSLAEGALPGLLRELYVGRRSGELHFTGSAGSCSVIFRYGQIVNARTDAPADWMGETLLRQGLVTREQLDRANELVVGGARLGEALKQTGAIDDEQLQEGIAQHVRQILYRVVGWKEGSYAFEEREEFGSEEITLKVPTGEVILEAVRRVEDPQAVAYGLGDIDRVLCLSSDPMLRFQNIRLRPTDGYVVSRVDGTLSAREVIQLSPLDHDETCQSLFGLLCTGVIEYMPGPPKARTPPPAPIAAPPVAPAPGLAAAVSPAAAAAPPPAAVVMAAAAPPPLPAPDAEELEKRRREVEEAYEGLRTRSHYEVLGVLRTASDAEIKEAYFRLVRRYHPDAHGASSLGDMRDKLEAVFIRLGQAYEVLRSVRSRSSYDSSLTVARAAAALAAAPEPPPPVDPEKEKRLAAENLRRAEKHLAEAKYWDAIQLLESAAPWLEGKQKQRALLGLARALVKNPKWAKRAEETLQELLRLNPQHAEALFELGLIYKASGFKSRATTTFRRVLEAQPDHEQAAAELAAMEPDEPEPPPSGGLLKKLFRR